MDAAAPGDTLRLATGVHAGHLALLLELLQDLDEVVAELGPDGLADLADRQAEGGLGEGGQLPDNLALAVAFGTVAIPLAFDARWTSAAWALEGAALVWVGVRQHRLLATAAGAALVFLAGLFFIEAGWRHDAGLPVLNGNVLGGLMVSLAGLLLGAIIWLLFDIGLLRAESMSAVTWIVLVALSAVLAIGVSWSHVWRRVTGQINVDDVED